jgi:hypothetical protein
VVDGSDPGAVVRVGAGDCAATVPVVVTPTFTG